MRIDEIFGFGKKQPTQQGIPYSEFVKRKPDQPSPTQRPNQSDADPTATSQRNLMKWFGKSLVRDGSGNPKRVFHGTPKEISTGVFKPSPDGVYGPGIYFTSSTTTASNYATGKRSATRGAENVQGNVIPVYLKIERPLTPVGIIQNKQFVQDLLNVLDPPSFKRMIGMGNKNPGVVELIRLLKSDSAKPISICYVANNTPNLARPIYSVIRKHFDGIIVSDQASGHMEYIVWYATQVKSALSNNGDYNPVKGHMSENAN